MPWASVRTRPDKPATTTTDLVPLAWSRRRGLVLGEQPVRADRTIHQKYHPVRRLHPTRRQNPSRQPVHDVSPFARDSASGRATDHLADVLTLNGRVLYQAHDQGPGHPKAELGPSPTIASRGDGRGRRNGPGGTGFHRAEGRTRRGAITALTSTTATCDPDDNTAAAAELLDPRQPRPGGFSFYYPAGAGIDIFETRPITASTALRRAARTRSHGTRLSAQPHELHAIPHRRPIGRAHRRWDGSISSRSTPPATPARIPTSAPGSRGDSEARPLGEQRQVVSTSPRRPGSSNGVNPAATIHEFPVPVEIVPSPGGSVHGAGFHPTANRLSPVVALPGGL